MRAHHQICGCVVRVDLSPHAESQVSQQPCRVHENAHRLLNIVTRLARGSRVTAREVEDVLADAGVSLLTPAAVGGPVGLARALALHQQSLVALNLEPLIATPWNKAQAVIRANVRIELGAEIAALQALKKQHEGDAVVPSRGDQCAEEVARG